MYELSRVRLHSVGPPGARYQDVLLDFSGAGEPVGVQGDLLGEDSEPSRRPSPASVLFLENGGGKSVLIKLIFSVVLPGRRQVVGTSSTRVLEQFVLPDDVANVAVEWMHTSTGQRLVTGKVSEWRGHVGSPDPANLLDSWYCFRPGPALELETLPLTEDGRLLTMTAYRDRLGELAQADPRLDLFWTRRQGEWTERLDALGIDPELFRYQRAMNAGEGEAADAFSFATDEAFVEFLLRAVLPEDGASELAEVLANYADSLAQRGELALEREFVEGALELLDPLAREQSLATAQQTETDQVRARLAAFAASIAARADAESERLDEHTAQVEQDAETSRLADSELRRKQAEVAALRRALAALRLDEATAQQQAADAELADAKHTAHAWRETATVLDKRGSEATADRLRELARSKEEKARPALAAKNDAASALANGLRALAEDAAARAEREQRAAGELTQRASTAQAEQNEAGAEAATATARADGYAERIEEVRARVRTAVAEGLLEREDADVPAAAETARQRRYTVTEELSTYESDAERLADEHSAAQLALQEARQHAAGARERHERAVAERDKANNRTAELAAQPRLAELLEVNEVALETDYEALRRLLAESGAEAGRKRLELEVAEASDKQARLALEGGDLLPPPPEIAEVCATLEEAGITAWPGWTYLSRITDVAERARIAEHAPQLASGVLLNDAGQTERAAAVLRERRLAPSTFVAVGTTAALRQGASPPAADFVVPANPALYDPDAAAVEQTAIARRHTERQQHLTELGDRQGEDEALAGRLAAWREEYPEGTLAQLADAMDTAQAEVEQANELVVTRGEELERIAAERVALRERVPAARERLRAVEDTERRLGELAEQVGRLSEWQLAERRERETVNGQTERLREQGAAAEQARAEAAEHQRAADGHAGTAERARAELAEVPGEVDHDAGAPEEPVEVLRRTYRDAAEAYARVEVGSDLRAELDQAERAEAAARAAVQAIDPEIAELAARLLEGPGGADTAARTAAAERSERAVEAAEGRRSSAIATVATRKAELAALPEAGEATRVERPHRVPDAQERIDSALAEETAAQQEQERARRAYESAVRAHQAAKESAEGFRALYESLSVSGQGSAEPFESDVQTARTRYTELRSECAHAEELAERGQGRVRQASDALAQFATEQRFEQLGVPVRRQILAVRRAELPGYAQQWAEALRPRLRSLTDDLAAIDRHRSGIVTRLHGMVEDALRTLRSAQRVSRLPDELGDWSGQEFLRVAFNALEDTELIERLGEVVDEAALGRTKAGRQIRSDGTTLVLRGVLAAAPKGFRVEMLKPDAVLRTERQRVSEIRDVFSGGQQLTAAILLYCTLAALRANSRGRANYRHAGVLFLDNPIGRASAGYLIELQRAVARALGVQLIYTTGLFDANALAEFPMIVRLRNDADLRAGRKYLAVDDTVRARLDALPDADETASVTATRVFQQEQPAEQQAG